MAILRDMMPKSAMTADDGRLMQARVFSEAFPKSMNRKLNLVLNGPCRTGKTYLAWQLMKSALMNGKSIGSLSGAMMDVTQLAQLTLPDVVLFDEFSKVDFMDKAAMRFVFNLVNARTEDKKVTIFISNITPAELESVATMASPMMAPSIFARINESKIARVIS
jgi:DNA replication protein DnaC